MRQTLKLALSVIALLFLTCTVKSQEPAKPKFEFKPYGFVGYDIYLDTYKSLDSRDGELYFYPLKPQLDKNDKDANAKTMLEMTGVTSRLGTKISGPDFFGAKTSGLLEMDFFGTSQDHIQLFRLRHAMINLKWEKSELLVGNYWHPVILTEMIPGVVAFGAGAPFHSLNRSGQIKYTYHFSPVFRLTGAAVIHGYHRSKGVYDAQRYSGKPDVQLQLSIGNRKEFMAGFTAGYKWLTPRLYVEKDTMATAKTIGSYNLHAFLLVKPASTSIKLEAIYGQNLTFLSMIGGYGMKTGTNVTNDDYGYTNLKTLSLWADIQQDINRWSIGIFTGYQKLMGADDNYTTIKDYNLNDDLSYVFRLSPRVVYKADALSLAFEYMLTTAVYGKAWDAKRKVTDTMDPVSNNRFLVRATYSF